jgi:hypothetical protein
MVGGKMKDCTHCKHAAWNLTMRGALHPSGEGKCTYEVKLPPLPASKRWWWSPRAMGGDINRRKPLTEHCVYWAHKDSQ